MAWKYKRLMPKVIALTQNLLTSQELLDLLGRSLDEILGVLTTSPYKTMIEEIPANPVDATSMERALNEHYIRTLESIVDASPKDIQHLLATIITKFEVYNIKALLRAKKAKLSVDEAMRHVIPVGKLDDSSCRKVYMNADSYTDIIGQLSDSDYPLLLDENDTVDELFSLEASLDTAVYRQIWNAAGRLRGKDKKIVETIIGMEIESATLKAMLRGKALGISKEYILRYIQPLSVFSEKDYEAAFDQVDIRSTIEFLGKVANKASRDFRFLLQDLLKEFDASHSLSKVEAVFDRNLLTASYRILKRHTPFFNVGPVLVFLNAKWFEIRNLITITRGAVDELPPERIIDLLILPDTE